MLKALVWKRLVFFNITESGWFWKRLPRNKVPNNLFIKSVQKQPYVDILQNIRSLIFLNRKTPVLESLFNRVAGLQACNFMKKRLQHSCFPMNIVKFLRTFIWRTYANYCFWAICRPLLNQKHNVGWFLLRKFVYLARVYFLHIISKNHSNTFLLMNQQKKNLSKVKYCSPGYLFW